VYIGVNIGRASILTGVRKWWCIRSIYVQVNSRDLFIYIDIVGSPDRSKGKGF